MQTYVPFSTHFILYLTTLINIELTTFISVFIYYHTLRHKNISSN
nr:MAG TPA: hypothetical protein [Bacteriophage sp.]